jgi:hypothetical protein
MIRRRGWGGLLSQSEKHFLMFKTMAAVPSAKYMQLINGVGIRFAEL